MKLDQGSNHGMEKAEADCVVFLKGYSNFDIAKEAFLYSDLIQGISPCFYFCLFIR